MTGVLWAMVAGAGFGVFQALNRRAGRSIDSYVSTFLLLVVSSIILVVLSLLTEDLRLLGQAPPMALVNFGLAGLVHFLLGWTFLNLSQKRVGAARTSALIGTTPLFAFVVGLLFFGEVLSLPVIAGAVVLKVGGLVVDGIPEGLLVPMIVGVLTSFVAGWVAVWGTLRLVRTRSFTPFVVYRVALGVVVLVVAGAGWR